MILIVGLGNPGEKFHHTRHNVGFEALEAFAGKHQFPEFTFSKKYQADISEGAINEQKIILAKPQTFMNDSGKAVKSLVANYKLQDSSLIVIHDEIDLPTGTLKIVKERGAAGHKGVESIIQNVGNEHLVRIRIGIGNLDNQKAKDIVLEKFSKEEQMGVQAAIEKTGKALELFIDQGLEKTMNEYNR